MNLARLTTKGQMTIPKRVRQAAGLREGDVVSRVGTALADIAGVI